MNHTRAASAGGGGIRSGDGAPRLLNNVILSNRAMYGGGGIWVNNSLVGSRLPSLIENNTIIGNSSSGTLTTPIAARGGALIVSNNANVVARNNILWANTQAQGGPVLASGAAFALSYSAIENGYAGTGNIAVYCKILC